MSPEKSSDLFTASVHASASDQALPFAHLNLRRNPFGELEREDRAALAVVDVDRWLRRLERPGFAVQFVGDKGHGKTTHLLALKQHLPRAGYVHVGEGQRPRIPQTDPLLIDEIQRLPAGRRRRVFRARISLAIGSHVDFGAELARAGFKWDTVRVADALDAERLYEILNRRIQWARRRPGRVPKVTLRTAQSLLDRFGGNVRAMEARMYDLFQQLPEIRDV
jgi:hypothetical protein